MTTTDTTTAPDPTQIGLAALWQAPDGTQDWSDGWRIDPGTPHEAVVAYFANCVRNGDDTLIAYRFEGEGDWTPCLVEPDTDNGEDGYDDTRRAMFVRLTA